MTKTKIFLAIVLIIFVIYLVKNPKVSQMSRREECYNKHRDFNTPNEKRRQFYASLTPDQRSYSFLSNGMYISNEDNPSYNVFRVPESWAPGCISDKCVSGRFCGGCSECPKPVSGSAPSY